MRCMLVSHDRTSVMLQNKEMPALKKASVGEITAGNKDTFVAAEKGESQNPEEKDTLLEDLEKERIEALKDPAENQQPQVRILEGRRL